MRGSFAASASVGSCKWARLDIWREYRPARWEPVLQESKTRDASSLRRADGSPLGNADPQSFRSAPSDQRTSASHPVLVSFSLRQRPHSHSEACT